MKRSLIGQKKNRQHWKYETRFYAVFTLFYAFFTRFFQAGFFIVVSSDRSSCELYLRHIQSGVTLLWRVCTQYLFTGNWANTNVTLLSLKVKQNVYFCKLCDHDCGEWGIFQQLWKILNLCWKKLNAQNCNKLYRDWRGEGEGLYLDKTNPTTKRLSFNFDKIRTSSVIVDPLRPENLFSTSTPPLR